MSDTTFLYTLNCPKTGQVRYIGKSDNPFARFYRHLLRSKAEDSYKARWIVSLQSAGLQPTMELLDEVPVSEWESWEREYIRVFRAIRIPLTNTSEGGDGFRTILTPEIREKLGRGSRGKKFSAERSKALSMRQAGRKRPESTRQRISEARKKFFADNPEARVAVSKSLFGKKRSEESRAKQSFSLKQTWAKRKRMKYGG